MSSGDTRITINTLYLYDARRSCADSVPRVTFNKSFARISMFHTKHNINKQTSSQILYYLLVTFAAHIKSTLFLFQKQSSR